MFFFALHDGHLDSKAERRAVAKVEREFKDDYVTHVDYEEPNGQKRGWWQCRNMGNPFDQQTARDVLRRYSELLGSGA